MANDPIITPPLFGIPMPTPPVKRVRTPHVPAQPKLPPKGRPPTYPPSQGHNPRDHDYGPKTGREGTITPYPSEPCFHCGAARWCDHRKPDK